MGAGSLFPTFKDVSMKALLASLMITALGLLQYFKADFLPSRISDSWGVTVVIYVLMFIAYIYYEKHKENLTRVQLEYDLYRCFNFVFPFLKKHYESKVTDDAYNAFERIMRLQKGFNEWGPTAIDSDDKVFKWTLSCQWRDIFLYAQWTKSIPTLVFHMNREQTICPNNYDVFTQALLCHEEITADNWGYGRGYGREHLPGLKITRYPGRELGPQHEAESKATEA